MKKNKTKFVCNECGYEALKWLGKCPGCNNWNTFTEEIEKRESKMKRASSTNISKEPKSIKDISISEYNRQVTGINELDRVLGGGVVLGSLILISGEPGIGKSTLILQASNMISINWGNALYVSGEESIEQIKLRAKRLDTLNENLLVVSETNISVIENYIEKYEPKLLIIDSIQTLYQDDITSAPGSVSQVKECVNHLMRIGKGRSMSILIVAHVTKQGDLAGPRVLEHMVDTVLHFEGDRTADFRILRAMKNRFGTTSEIGVFEMRNDGLKEILNPSEMFLDSLNEKNEGSVVIGTMEGTRPLLVEVQGLVSHNNIGFARRTAVGIDNNRLNILVAVLEKKLGIPLENYDIYINVIGGLKLEGTFYDLGVAISIYSSFKGIEIPSKKILAVGEISLTGEVRSVSNIEKIIKEAEKMGFENILIPFRNKEKLRDNYKINIIGIKTIKGIGKLFK